MGCAGSHEADDPTSDRARQKRRQRRHTSRIAAMNEFDNPTGAGADAIAREPSITASRKRHSSKSKIGAASSPAHGQQQADGGDATEREALPPGSAAEMSSPHVPQPAAAPAVVEQQPQQRPVLQHDSAAKHLDEPTARGNPLAAPQAPGYRTVEETDTHSGSGAVLPAPAIPPEAPLRTAGGTAAAPPAAAAHARHGGRNDEDSSYVGEHSEVASGGGLLPPSAMQQREREAQQRLQQQQQQQQRGVNTMALPAAHRPIPQQHHSGTGGGGGGEIESSEDPSQVRKPSGALSGADHSAAGGDSGGLLPRAAAPLPTAARPLGGAAGGGGRIGSEEEASPFMADITRSDEVRRTSSRGMLPAAQVAAASPRGPPGSGLGGSGTVGHASTTGGTAGAAASGGYDENFDPDNTRKRSSTGRFTTSWARGGSVGTNDDSRRQSSTARVVAQSPRQPMAYTGGGGSEDEGSLSDIRHGSMQYVAMQQRAFASGAGGGPGGGDSNGPAGGGDSSANHFGGRTTTPMGSIFAGSQFSRMVVQRAGPGPSNVATQYVDNQALTAIQQGASPGTRESPIQRSNSALAGGRVSSTSSSFAGGGGGGSGSPLVNPLTAHAISHQFQHAHATVNREGFRRRRDIVLAYMKQTTLDRVRSWIDKSDHGETALGPLSNPMNLPLTLGKEMKVKAGTVQFGRPLPYPVLLKAADPSLPDELLVAFTLNRQVHASRSASSASNNTSDPGEVRRASKPLHQ